MLELVHDAVRGCEQVLEVAAGTGVVTTAIAQSAGTVIATDYAAAMVAILAQRVRDAGFGNVTCVQADLYELRYRTGEFDAVVAANVLHLVPDLPGALAALRRVLRQGGRLIIPTFCHNETALSWLISRALAVTGFPSHRRFTSLSLRTAVEQAGLKITRVETLRGLIPIGYVEGTFEPGGAL